MTENAKINYYILFENYTDGLAMQALLKENGIRSRISPAPRSIQGELGCGMSLLIDEEEIDAVRSCIKKNNPVYYDIKSLPCQRRCLDSWQ